MKLYAAVVLAASAQAAMGDWSVREHLPADGDGKFPVAFTREAGTGIEVFMTGRDAIRLNVSLPRDSGNRFGPACPTLQIDRRLPLLRPPPGHECVVTPVKVSILLGHRAGHRVHSRVLYALVNGTRLALRYQTQEHRYVELVFPLTGSKRAVKAALGGSRIQPE